MSKQSKLSIEDQALKDNNNAKKEQEKKFKQLFRCRVKLGPTPNNVKLPRGQVNG